MKKVLTLVGVSLILIGCSSRYPKPIDMMVSTESNVRDVQHGVSSDHGDTVRWGGVIANVNNLEKTTWIEVVQLPLKSSGRPTNSDVSQGRFLVKVEGFLDPAIYAAGREFTVVGILSGMTDGKVGDFDYKFPVVASQGYYLWPQIREKDYYQGYLYPVTFWNPYLPYYYPLHYRYPGPMRPRIRPVQPNPTVNPPANRAPARLPSQSMPPVQNREPAPKNRKMR
jgi:outer membrane lipoprotein